MFTRGVRIFFVVFMLLSGLTIMQMTISIDNAYAWYGDGFIWCDVNQNGEIDEEDTPLMDVELTTSNLSGTYSHWARTHTDPDGSSHYSILLPDVDDQYVTILDESTLPSDAVFIIPDVNEYYFEITSNHKDDRAYWLIDSEICHPVVEGQCWLTAGGVKFSTLTGTMVDEFKGNGPMHNWGGNVNPACAPNKGHWNHIAHKDNLHFQATDIEVIQCGNVPGIEPGSESPVTPFNFIEFTGPATLKGIKGNKDDFGSVCYFARAEDRNEPGSHGAKDGNDIDRYFLDVFDCDSGETLLLVDIDGDPISVDPVTITGGNMQMHWKPCDN